MWKELRLKGMRGRLLPRHHQQVDRINRTRGKSPQDQKEDAPSPEKQNYHRLCSKSPGSFTAKKMLRQMRGMMMSRGRLGYLARCWWRFKSLSSSSWEERWETRRETRRDKNDEFFKMFNHLICWGPETRREKKRQHYDHQFLKTKNFQRQFMNPREMMMMLVVAVFILRRRDGMMRKMHFSLLYHAKIWFVSNFSSFHPQRKIIISLRSTLSRVSQFDPPTY